MDGTMLYSVLEGLGLQYFSDRENRAALVLFPGGVDGAGTIAVQIRHIERAEEFAFLAEVAEVPEGAWDAAARYIATEAGTTFKVTFALTERGAVLADTTVYLRGVSDVEPQVERALALLVGAVREASPRLRALAQEPVAVMRPTRSVEELLAGEFRVDTEE